MRRLLLSLALAAVPAPTPEPAATYRLEHGPYVRVAGPSPGRVHTPGAIDTAADGRIAVADFGITVLAADGAPLWTAPIRTGPDGVAFGPDGSVWVGEDGQLHHFAADGTELATITDGLSAHATLLRPHVITVGGDGRVHALCDGQLMTWAPDGHRELATPVPDAVRSIAADSAGRVFRGGNDGIDLLAADHGVAKHITDAGGQVLVDPADRLIARTDTDFVTYDADFDVVETVPVATPGDVFAFAVTAAGEYLTTARQPRITRQAADGTLLSPLADVLGADLFRPVDLATAPDGGVFVADADNRRVVRFGPDGGFAGTVWAPDLPGVSGVAAFPDGDALVTANDNDGTGTVARVGPSGTVRWTAVVPGNVRLSAAVAPDGTAWVHTPDGLAHFGADGTALGTIPYTESPVGLAIDGAGRFYVEGAHNLVVLNPDGSLYERYGGYAFYANFSVTPDGALYSTDSDPWTVRDPSGARVGGEAYWASGMDRVLDIEPVSGGAYLLDDTTHAVVRTTLTSVPVPTASPSAVPSPEPSAAPPVAATPSLRVLTRQARVRKGRIALRVRCVGAPCTGRVRLGSAAGR